jgi:hypothetical protein
LYVFIKKKRLKKTHDLEARERAQNAFRNSLQKYKIAMRTAKENILKNYVEENMNKDSWCTTYGIMTDKLKTANHPPSRRGTDL